MATCYLYDNCNKKDCDRDFCLRKYKMDSLYSAALMSESQKKRIALRGSTLLLYGQISFILLISLVFIPEGFKLGERIFQLILASHSHSGNNCVYKA